MIRKHIIEDVIASTDEFDDELLSIFFPNDQYRPALVVNMNFAITYSKSGGALQLCEPGQYCLTDRGKRITSLSDDDANAACEEVNRDALAVHAERRKRLARQDHVSKPDPDVPLDADVDQDEDAWKSDILDELHSGIAEAERATLFEKFCTELLNRIGYDLEHRGKQSRDGGIDAEGLGPPDLLTGDRPRVAVQCKLREPGKQVSIKDIREFREVIGDAKFDQGIFITTGRFAKDVQIDEAKKRPPRVTYIDGDILCDLTLKHEFGIKLIPTLNEEFFTEFRRKHSP